MLSTLKSPPEARRVTLGNFLFKLIGCICSSPSSSTSRSRSARSASSRRRRSCCSICVQRARSRWSSSFFTGADRAHRRALLPTRAAIEDAVQAPSSRPVGASHTHARDLVRRPRGAADRRRHRADAERAPDRAQDNDRALAERLRKMDDVVDDLYTAVKLYLTQISREALEQADSRRWADIVSFTINMEQVGDIIERIIIELEEKKIDKGRNFSDGRHGGDLRSPCTAHRQPAPRLSVFLNGD
jgi:phosphate:Na+ symporter